MKRLLSYLLYIFVTLAITYVFNWILVLFIGGVRFTAADGPPGDISLFAKFVFSLGVPVFYLICLTIVFLFYRTLLRQFAIELQKLIPIIFNVLIALYLIVSFSNSVFDSSLFS